MQRTALSVDDIKLADYLYVVHDAIEDEEGYITCRLDFDGPSNKFQAYCITKDSWTFIDELDMFELQPDFTNKHLTSAELTEGKYTKLLT